MPDGCVFVYTRKKMERNKDMITRKWKSNKKNRFWQLYQIWNFAFLVRYECVCGCVRLHRHSSTEVTKMRHRVLNEQKTFVVCSVRVCTTVRANDDMNIWKYFLFQVLKRIWESGYCHQVWKFQIAVRHRNRSQFIPCIFVISMLLHSTMHLKQILIILKSIITISINRT